MGEMSWIMAEIGVHLEDEIMPSRERKSKSSYVCGAKPHLLGALDDMYARLMHRDRFHDLTCPVRRAVVDDQDLEPFILLEDRSDETRDVFALIVGRDDNESSFSHLGESYSPGSRRSRQLRTATGGH